MKLELTEQEANELIKLLDLSVRAQGLSSAQSALFFWNKLKQAFSDPQMIKEEEVKNE